MKERKRLFARLWDLPYGYTTPYNLFDASKNSRDLVQKFQLQRKVPVHNGCVNSICWNETGNYLLSGSDDQHLAVIKASDYSVLAYTRTGHRANIFSAKFLPSCGDSHVVSSSGDGVIIYSNLERPETSLNNKFGCHRGTAYEIMTVPSDPNTFLSCGEDRTVRWFDIRTKTSCNAEDCKDDVLIFCRSPVTTIAINPLIPYQLAVGCADSSVQIFDRRMLTTQATAGCLSNGFRALMTYFTVPDFPQNRRITSLCYSKDGREILVNYSSDHIYLFDTKDDMGRKSKVLSCTDNNGPYGRTRPVMKRLRVRGDWSDTGPNSRPETESENRDGSSPNNLVRRMTDILTRMLFNSAPSRTSSNASRSSSESSPLASSHSEEGDAEAAPEANNSAGVAQTTEVSSEVSTSQTSDNNENASQSVPVSELTQTQNVTEQISEISSSSNNSSALEQENAVPEPLLIVDTYRAEDGLIPPYFMTLTGLEQKIDGPQTLVTESGRTYIIEEIEAQPSTSRHVTSGDAGQSSTSSEVQETEAPPSNALNSEEIRESQPSVSPPSVLELQEKEPSTSHSSNSDEVQARKPSTSHSSNLDEVQERQPSTSHSSNSDEVQQRQPSISHSSNSDEVQQRQPSISHSSNSDEVRQRQPSISCTSLSNEIWERGPSTSRLSTSNEVRQREIVLSEENFYSDAHNLTCTCTKEPPPPPSPTYELETPPEFSPEYEEHMSRLGEVGSESETEAAVQSIQRGEDIPSSSELQSPRSPSPGADQAMENPEEVELMMEVDSWDSDSDDGGSQPRSSQSNRRRRRGHTGSSCDEMDTDRKNEVKKYKPPKNVTRPRVKKVYTGHRNARTMIKECAFWGDDFVMSGSDCGHIFIWDRHTTELVMIMEADHHVVNCLQPHPFDPILASSGIDYDIKIWAPMREEPFFDVEKANEIVNRNAIMLEVTKDTITVPASFMFNMFNTLNNLRNGSRQLYRLNRAARSSNADSTSNR